MNIKEASKELYKYVNKYQFIATVGVGGDTIYMYFRGKAGTYKRLIKYRGYKVSIRENIGVVSACAA